MSCSKKLCQTKFGPEVFNKVSPFDKSKVYLTGSIHHTYEIKKPTISFYIIQYKSICYNIVVSCIIWYGIHVVLRAMLLYLLLHPQVILRLVELSYM